MEPMYGHRDGSGVTIARNPPAVSHVAKRYRILLTNQSVEWTSKNLRTFLEEFLVQSNAENVHFSLKSVSSFSRVTVVLVSVFALLLYSLEFLSLPS